MSKFTTEEKVRIVLDGMRYPEGITGLCRQVGISRSTYYHWQRTPLEKGKDGLITRRNEKTNPQLVDDLFRSEVLPDHLFPPFVLLD